MPAILVCKFCCHSTQHASLNPHVPKLDWVTCLLLLLEFSFFEPRV